MDRAIKDDIKQQYRRHENDSGSSEVQIALLSKRIESLTQHLKTNSKDHSSRYGLIKMVSARRKLLNYIRRNDEKRYSEIVQRLKLRR